MPDAYLDAAAIHAATFVRHIEIHDTLGSTNNRAIELVRDARIELPALVAARHQTSGRGRGGHTWWSADGALTFSIVLDPAALGINTQYWPQLSLTTAVAVCDALTTEFNPQSANLAIKWPNDIMLDGAKACGILIESPGGVSPAKDRLIIGIGINVNNSYRRRKPATHRLAPQDNQPPKVAALCDATGLAHDLQQLLCATLCALSKRISQLAAKDPQLPIIWQQLCWLRGREITVDAPPETIEGVCSGIDEDGALLVTTTGASARIYSGSISSVGQ